MAFEEAVAAYDAVDAAFDQADAVGVDGLSNDERAELLGRREAWRRRLPAGGHELINELGRAPVEQLGGPLRAVLADRLRIGRGEAAGRIAEAADLGPRRALSGEPLAPRLEATAARQRWGVIGAEQVRVIRRFFERLPGVVDEPTRAEAGRRLAAVAAAYRPDELARFADHMALVLNPDGFFPMRIGPAGAVSRWARRAPTG